MIITREFGVRYQGLDTIVDKDPTRHFKTASLVRPDGREELIRKGSPLSFGAVAISQDGKMLVVVPSSSNSESSFLFLKTEK